jgi:ribosome-binding factor A
MSRRTEKIASLIRRVVGEAIAHHLNDPRVSPLASVTQVKVTEDLQYADVWISVLGSEGEERTTLAGLQHASGYLQGLLARALAARQCPLLRFKLDPSIKKGFETLRLIDQAMAELADTPHAEPEAPPPKPGSQPDAPGEHP